MWRDTRKATLRRVVWRVAVLTLLVAWLHLHVAPPDRGVVWGWGDDVVPRPVGVNGVAMYVAAGTRHCGVILSNKHASVRKGLTLDEAEADERKTRS